jgi:exonuclease III
VLVQATLVLLLFTPALRAQNTSTTPIVFEDAGNALRRIWDRIRGQPRAPQSPPDDVAHIVSWNLQAFGARVPAKRRAAVGAALSRALGGWRGPVLFAAQEIANEKGERAVAAMLPGSGWTESFEDTSDAMDNALFAGAGVRIDCSYNLLEGFVHPPRVAHVSVADADFTLISVHLTYDKGDAQSSDGELEHLLQWIKTEAARPGADPDFIVAGDFNLATRAGKLDSSRAHDQSWTPLEDMLGGSSMTALVDEPTSRSGRNKTANNYDHFLVSARFLKREFMEAQRLDEAVVLEAEKQAGTRASDHFPVVLALKTRGVGRDGAPIARDGASNCRR